MKKLLGIVLAVMMVLAFPLTALASDVDVAVVDVTAPTGSVTLAPGETAPISINMTVTGNQTGTATFEIYRNWTLTGGVFTGSNPQEFTVYPRAGGDPATTFSTSGTVSVAASQADGGFTLTVGAFDITNSNATGAKLGAGTPSSYSVTVETLTPAAVDTTTTVTSSINPSVLGQAVTLTATVRETLSNVAVTVGTVTFKEGTATLSGPTSLDSSGQASFITSSLSAGSHTIVVEYSGSGNFNPGSGSIVQYVTYDFSGFLPPIKTDGSSVFKLGSTVPVKLQLTDYDGNYITNAVAKIMLAKVSSGVVGAEEEGISTSAASTGNLFRYDPTDNQYIFNLSTKSLSTGTWKITVDLYGPSNSYNPTILIGLK